MAINEITATFTNGREATVTDEVYQYNYGMRLIISGVELTETYEVQFCNDGDEFTITSVGDETGVDIPDQYFISGKSIYGYVYLHTSEDDGVTAYRVFIPIIRRPRPSEIQPSPDERSALTQALEALQQAIDVINGLTVSATTLAPGSDATVEKEMDEETNEINIAFGIPTGAAPVRGTDYWTAEDKEEIVSDVLNTITGGSGRILVVETGD